MTNLEHLAKRAKEAFNWFLTVKYNHEQRDSKISRVIYTDALSKYHAAEKAYGKALDKADINGKLSLDES
jgi:hypothetical protein